MMSDGGKGSSPRPFSVDRKTFSDNWDAIFGKKKNRQLCSVCYTCLEQKNTHAFFSDHMIVCEICGNKRCPHATDHEYECTNSNEPGQKGSLYK